MTWIWTQIAKDPRVWRYTHEGQTFTVRQRESRWVAGRHYSVYSLDGDATEYTSLVVAMRAASRSLNIKFVSHRWIIAPGIA